MADYLSDLLKSTTPLSLEGRKGEVRRAKIDFTTLEKLEFAVRNLAERPGSIPSRSQHGYPHFFYLDDRPKGRDGWVAYDLSGEHVRPFLNFAASRRDV